MNFTPGEILPGESLQPMGISRNVMARAIGVPPRTVNEIVLGKRAITPAISIRFGAFFGQSGDFRQGIQVGCDSRSLRKEKAKLTAKFGRVGELVGGRVRPVHVRVGPLAETPRKL